MPDRLVARPGWTAAGLLLLFASLAVTSLLGDSATFDETTHLPAGVSYLERGDFRHNAEHPPLAKAWAALPVVALGLADPDYAGPHWRGRRAAPGDPHRSRANQWLFGFETLNGPLDRPDRRDPGRALVPARSMIVVLGVLGGLICWRWSRALWGEAGGLVALSLWSLSPTVLAHARLVTTDLPAAVGMLASAWTVWRWTVRPTHARAAAVGVVFGLALLTKFSALLVPGLLAPGIATALAGSRRRVGAPRVLAAGALAVGLAWLVVWAGYGFRWSAVADPGYRLEWESMEAGADESVGKRFALWLRDERVVPEAYAFGLAYVAGGAQRRVAFLDGETSIVGWRRYFPEAFLLKTPLPTLGMLAAAIAFAVARLRRRRVEWAFLAFPPVAYLAASMAAHLNLGHRHLLPIYPFLFVGAGALARVAAGRIHTSALVAALVGLAVATGSVAPGYLAFFNTIGGGPTGGWRHLVDSNIDWGQDLARLARVIERDGIGRVHLAYFGTADPRAYDIPYVKTVWVHDFRPDEPQLWPRAGDVLAISVTLLQGVYLDRDREFAEAAVRAGAIRPDDVRSWLSLRDRESRAGRDVAPLGRWLVAEGKIDEPTRARLAARLMTSRLERLRDEEVPFARAGDSILLYRWPPSASREDREPGLGS